MLDLGAIKAEYDRSFGPRSLGHGTDDLYAIIRHIEPLLAEVERLLALLAPLVERAPTVRNDDDNVECAYCGGTNGTSWRDRAPGIAHEADCPWLLAHTASQ